MSTTDEAMRDELSFLLARANALSLAASADELHAVGLRVRSYAVLLLCAEDRRLTQRELADVLRLDPSQIVALVDGLELDEFVTRRADADDRRVRVISITDKGRETLSRARPAAQAAEDRVFDVLTASERSTLVDLLRRVAFPKDAT